jgi:hypothetical protein
MSYWPIFKNQKDVDCVSDDEVQERVRPLLLAIEKAVDDWKPGIQETRGDEAADECEEVLMSCAFRQQREVRHHECTSPPRRPVCAG